MRGEDLGLRPPTRRDLERAHDADEIAAGGRTQSEVFAAHGFAPARYRFRLLALDPPRAELHARIDARVPLLFERGLLDETSALLARSGGLLPPKLPIGYAEAAAVLAGRLDRAEAVHRVRVAHRRYARRQVIWLRREPDVEWLSPEVDVAALAADIAAWLAGADAPRRT